jgi:dihydrofolate reductase
MRVSAIAALDRSGLIGSGGRMPWHLPHDLKRFRKSTWGKPIIMGRKTFASLDAPLPGRYNIVLSRTPGYSADGCHVVPSIADALAAAEEHLGQVGGDEAMVIGGSFVFRETLPRWDRAYLTIVEGRFEGDTYFPLAGLCQVPWRLIDHESCPADARNPQPHHFLALERVTGSGSTVEDFDIASWFDPRIPRVG